MGGRAVWATLPDASRIGCEPVLMRAAPATAGWVKVSGPAMYRMFRVAGIDPLSLATAFGSVAARTKAPPAPASM